LSQDNAAHDYRLTIEVARGLALWMTFEDTFRVADLKTRGARVSRIRDEVRAPLEQVLQVTEFMKPRVEEICGSLPTAIGRFLLRSPKLLKCIQRFAGDRQISTSTLSGFLFLRLLVRLGHWRRSTLRFIEETARIDSWLSDIRSLTAVNYDLALEVAACHRLVKGYGATHERGLRNYARVIAAAKAARIRHDVAANLRHWREAALADDDGIALGNALQG
jgi:indolepyruvate ferredoxin oxidoreductase beta subunit